MRRDMRQHVASRLWGGMQVCVLPFLLLLAHNWIVIVPPAYADVSFTAALNAGQEAFRLKQRSAPPTSGATGHATLNYHEQSRKVCYSISFQHFNGKETEAHFHAPATIGENAPVLFFISPPASGGPSAFGVPKVGCVGPLNKQELRWLRRGLWYLNVHTDKFPGGEIRGQVLSPHKEKAK